MNSGFFFLSRSLDKNISFQAVFTVYIFKYMFPKSHVFKPTLLKTKEKFKGNFSAYDIYIKEFQFLDLENKVSKARYTISRYSRSQLSSQVTFLS